MAKILLAGNAWKFRALLRAQLLEEGVEVEAFESVKDALESFRGPTQLPRLFLLDVTTSAAPAQEAAQLAPWASKFPIWILVRQGELSEKVLKSGGFERILHLPVDLRALIREIESRVNC